MLGVQLKTVSPSEFDTNARIYARKLSTTDDLDGVVSHIEKCQEGQSCCIQIIGDPGSGRTTFAQGICCSLIDNKFCTEQQLLFTRIQPEYNESSLWNLLSELAKEKQEKEIASVFSQTTVKLLKKLETLVQFLQLHFKVICLDDVGCDGLSVFKLISSALLRASCKVVMTSSEDIRGNAFNAWEEFHSVHVKGFLEVELPDHCAIFSSLAKQSLLSRAVDIFSRNPVAFKVFSNFVDEFNLSVEQTEDQLNNLERYKLENQQPCNNAVELVLRLISDWLDQTEMISLLQLSQLRQPLPVLKTQSVSKLARLSLLTIREGKQNNAMVVYFITMPTCIQRYFQDQFRKNKDDEVKMQEEFDVLKMWLSLLSKELLVLIDDAESSEWPFVPEKW